MGGSEFEPVPSLRMSSDAVARGAPTPPVSSSIEGGPLHLVWFKRDLRVHDHEPLLGAAQLGPVLGLYVFEPEVLSMRETDARHVAFILQSLAELRVELRRRGSDLLIRRGEVTEVLGRLRDEVGWTHLHSHEETGLGVTFDRDLRVKRWCRDRGLPWAEEPHFGVVRGLRSRDGWAGLWNRSMGRPPRTAPERFPELPDRARGATPGELPTLEALDFGPVPDRIQPGGEGEARRILDGFLSERGVNYRADMASPIAGANGCSRLSAHLAYGTIGLRTVHARATEARREYSARRAEGDPAVDPRWVASLRSFEKRLRWHCHFIQKLESEPEIEFFSMNRAYDGLRVREAEWTSEERARFDAWRSGRTGFPMVDAGMRALEEAGWINFRMRAMLVSFAAYHLWLDWRPVARELGRRFTDYEPGIHISQVQMQSGATGINQLRIYSPAKQVVDNDPEGRFVREWVPELREVSASWTSRPEEMPAEVQRASGCRIGRDYPEPIVDHRRAVAEARARIQEVRRSEEARRLAREVYRRHGSRGRRRPALGEAKRQTDDQLGLEL